MASNISYTSIDETYPIAGRDNDSQGFRDNFSVIRNNFESAKSEIEDLQINGARLNEANNFTKNNLLNFNAVYYTEEVYTGGSVNGPTVLIQFKNGPYQLFQISGDLTFNFSDFPDSEKYQKVRVELHNLDTVSPRYVTFGSSQAVTFQKGSSFDTIQVTTPSGNTYIPVASSLINSQLAVGGYTSFSSDPKVIRVPRATNSSTIARVVFDFWTVDGGSHIYWDFVGLFT
jgi:hypothetical protein